MRSLWISRITAPILGLGILAASHARASVIAWKDISKQDEARLKMEFIYVPMYWARSTYRELSVTRVPEHRATDLVVNHDRTRQVSVLELRHDDPKNIELARATTGQVPPSGPRTLVVMIANLFGSERQDLQRAKYFYDLGYDVLKLPAPLSESLLKPFPNMAFGDLESVGSFVIASVASYQRKYDIEPKRQKVIGFGSGYGASVMIKAAESKPHFFARTIGLGPIYDIAYAFEQFESLLKALPQTPTRIDSEQAARLWGSTDPQSVATEEFDRFAKFEIGKSLLSDVRNFCTARENRKELVQTCLKERSFAAVLRRFDMDKGPRTLLNSSNQANVYVLTTQNDPLNLKVVEIGHTRELESGGHLGFLGTDVERDFLKSALE